MLTENGCIKKTWSDLRQTIASLDPTFAQIVDTLDPDQTFSIYLVSYPYGEVIADTQNTFFPTPLGMKKINDENINKNVVKDLSYGSNSLPMTMVLEKKVEYFIYLKENEISIPWRIYEPGSLFPFETILNYKPERCYSPNGILMLTAGARSTFMLPNIGCATNHFNLQRDFKIQHSAPKTLFQHWHVFKEISHHSMMTNSWRCKLAFFSEKWLTKLHSDQAWLPLKTYLLEKGWQRFDYDRNRIYFDIAFSIIQQKRNLKPNPYLADTAKHLFTIALGNAPAYEPAVNEEALPLKIIQHAFTESYNLKKYTPTLLQPVNYAFETYHHPVYYSLQHPTTYSFSPKSRKMASTIFEMHELEHITKIFLEELSKKNNICCDTILNNLANNIKFNYFHNELDKTEIIKYSSEIGKLDLRFNFENSNMAVAEDAKFFRGCVSMANRNLVEN